MPEHVKEVARNTGLRRVDWRLLLRDDEAVTAAADAEPTLARAVAAISETVVELTRETRGCDLVVLSDPDPQALERAWRALRPGGACYCESTVVRPGGVSRARRELEDSGFVDVACFWPWPAPDRSPPRFWLPLGAPNALRYFLTTRPRPERLQKELAGVVARAVWSLAARLELLAPVCALAHKPAPNSPGGPDTLPLALRDGWERWRLGPTPTRVACLLQTGGRRSVNKVVLLAFGDEAVRPDVAVKLARVPESEAALTREAEALRSVAGSSTPRVRIPSVIFHEPLAGRLATGLSVAEGEPLTTSLDVTSYRAHGLEVTDFLADLAGGRDPSPPETWAARLVEPVLAWFELHFGRVVDPVELGTAAAALSELPDLPLVCEQRDLSPWNLLRAPDGGLWVLDWESAEPSGLPALDLVYFLAYGAFFLERTMDSGRERTTYARMLDGSSPAGSVFHDCVGRYIRATGIDKRALVPLRILLWMIHSQSEHERLLADVGGRADEVDLLSSVCLRLWREDVARAQGGAEATLRS